MYSLSWSIVPISLDQMLVSIHRIAASHQPEAVVLDLVNPVRPNGRPVGRAGQARFDEADRARSAERPHVTQQHGLKDRTATAKRESEIGQQTTAGTRASG